MAHEMKKQQINDDTNSQNREKDRGIAFIPVPESTELLVPWNPLGKPKIIWDYKDQNGHILMRNCRFINDGQKEDRPLTYRKFKNGTCKWAYMSLDIPRPLYGLDRLAANPEATVLICEGEKAADAAQILFPDFVAITSPNGAKSAQNADWIPLSGRNGIVWPDNDQPGISYAQTAAQSALKAGALSVSIVTVPDIFPEKWDLADPLPEGISLENIRQILAEAKPFFLPIDPLIGLVERAENDPGEAFKPDVIKALMGLRQDSQPAYESLLSKLKGTKKVRIGELSKVVNAAIAEENGEEVYEPNQTDILLDLSSDALLSHDKDGRSYASVMVDGHWETWPIKSMRYRQLLTKEYYESTGRAPNAESLSNALNVLQAKAHFGGNEETVFIRVGEHENKIYIDLCNEEWEVIEIDEVGWRIIKDSPVRFRRTSGMIALPTPRKGGSVSLLRQFVNVDNDSAFILAISWILAALRSRGPYPVLAVSGVQGSAKTTLVLLMKLLTDPNSSPLRTLSREERDLFIAANNGHVLAFDNLSGMPNWISDALCRLSTGGGFATRQLHTDQDEILFQAMRPVILNGIDDAITRPDLADRAIVLNLSPIPEDKRRAEKEVVSEFEAALPLILGALLDAMAHGLKAIPNTKLDSLPRMADFALWASACEGALWPAGTFMAAYRENCETTVDDVLEANPVASAVLSLMDIETEWSGTAGSLLEACNNEVSEAVQRSKFWPTSGRVLSNHLKRCATFLRKTGLEITWERSKDRSRTRIIKIKRLSGTGGDSSSLSSEDLKDIIFPAAPLKTEQTVPDDELKLDDQRIEDADDTDDADADFAPVSDHGDEMPL